MPCRWSLVTLVLVVPWMDGRANAADRPPVRALDPSYVPQVGDTVAVGTGAVDDDGEPFGVNTFASVPDLVAYLQLASVNNDAAIDKMEDQHKLILLDLKTKVLITALGPVVVDKIQVGRGALVQGVVCGEVKVLEGEHKNKVLYIQPHDLVRDLVDNNQPTPSQKATKSSKKKKKGGSTTAKKPATGASGSAASLLKMGQNLEKSEKTAGAIEFYQKTVKQFPASPEAKTAQGRLDALQKK